MYNLEYVFFIFVQRTKSATGFGQNSYRKIYLVVGLPLIVIHVVYVVVVGRSLKGSMVNINLLG